MSFLQANLAMLWPLRQLKLDQISAKNRLNLGIGKQLAPWGEEKGAEN